MTTPSKVKITKKGERWLSTGHPWVFASDVSEMTAEAGIVSVVNAAGKWIGWALASPRSKIALRILSHSRDAVDKEWWRAKLTQAIDLRKRLPIDSDAMRLVFAEADGLPSLIVDRYGDIVVFQTQSAGMEAFKGLLVDLLCECLNLRGILEKNDASVRKLEGLETVVQAVSGKVPERTTIREGGLKFIVDLFGGQKTGAFLDQRENRLLAGRMAAGRILDVFSYHGWFACHMAGHAEGVHCIESSEEAAAFIRENAKLNGCGTKVTIETANAFDLLKSFDRERRRYDVVNLDPPAFMKHKRDTEAGLSGYKEINLRAMKLLRPKGFLLTSSCSQALGAELFEELLAEAAFDTRNDLAIVAPLVQASDHPIRPHFPESRYLKGFCCAVRDS